MKSLREVNTYNIKIKWGIRAFKHNRKDGLALNTISQNAADARRMQVVRHLCDEGLLCRTSQTHAGNTLQCDFYYSL